MATHLIIYGHGAGDPGAVGNGENERDFNRKKLHPYIKKWADKSKDSFVFFDTSGNRDMFQETAQGWGMYSIKANQYKTINEFHEDAAGSSATGGHVIVSSSFKADSIDLNTAQVIRKLVGWWGGVSNTRGISYRSNLLNLNVAAQRGLNYRLSELGFITSSRDMNLIKKELDQYAKGIVESITGENLGGGTVKTTYYKQAKRYYKILEKKCGIYREANFKGKYRGTYAKDSVIWVSEVKEISKGVFSGKTPAGWISLNSKYVSDKI